MRIMKWLAFWIGTLALSFAAQAQTSVYPYSSGAVNIASAFAMDGSTTLTSAYMGTSGVEGLQVDIRLTAGNSSCTKALNVQIAGSPTTTGTYTTITDDAAYFNTAGSGSSFSYYVGGMPAYLKVVLSSFNNGGGTSCTAEVNITPSAFDRRVGANGVWSNGTSLVGAQVNNVRPVIVGGVYVANVDSQTVRFLQMDSIGNLKVTTNSGSHALTTPATTPVSVVSSAGGTAVFTTTAANPSFNLQNVGTVPVYCSTDTPTTSHFITGLAPDSVGGSTPNNDGGAWTETNVVVGTVITCIASSSTGKVAVGPK